MATPRAIAEQRVAATRRIEAATATLAQRFGVAVPDTLLNPTRRDVDLGRAQQLAAFADVLEQVIAADTSDASAARIVELETENDDLRQQLEDANGQAKQGNKGGSAAEGKPKGKA